MAVVRPFAGYRPDKSVVDKVAALPYDVYNRKEAKEEVMKEPKSFLRIDRPETNFDDDFDMYSEAAYGKARELLHGAFSDGTYIHDESPVYYIYELIMDGRSQTGIVAAASIDDYQNNIIKKHENTLAAKEQDRINHIYTCDAQTYGFTSDDGVTHNVWVITDAADIDVIRTEFADENRIYIADGHHRAASAVKVGLRKREENPGYTGEEEFNFFLSVLFPESELKILPYNRVVKDLKGMSKDEFFAKLAEIYDIEQTDAAYQPEEKGTVGMFIEDSWYVLKIHDELKSSDPVEGLDVSLLQNYVLNPILGIEDPRTDSRIAFVGGIRGLGELERRVNTDMKVAFSMYPTSIGELFDVADAGRLMPPKSTWFEPKLRSGIFIHRLDED